MMPLGQQKTKTKTITNTFREYLQKTIVVDISDNWQSWWPDNKNWHWTLIAVLAVIASPLCATFYIDIKSIQIQLGVSSYQPEHSAVDLSWKIQHWWIYTYTVQYIIQFSHLLLKLQKKNQIGLEITVVDAIKHRMMQ